MSGAAEPCPETGAPFVSAGPLPGSVVGFGAQRVHSGRTVRAPNARDAPQSEE